MDGELLIFSIKNLRQRKLRAALTLLGIVIGIAVVVSMVSIGEGLKSNIAEQMTKFGTNKIIIFPSGAMGPMTAEMKLRDADVDIVRDVNGVSDATGLVWFASYMAKFDGENRNIFMSGVDPKGIEPVLLEVGIYDLYSGRYIRNTDKDSVNIGWRTHTDLFSKEVKLRDKIEINGKDYKVVGIFKEMGARDDDYSVVMTLDEARRIADIKDKIFMIMVKTEEGSNPKTVAQNIQKRLEKKLGEDSVLALTTEDTIKTASSIMLVLEVVLGGLASIALIVGGIGIMNTMLMAVVERTKEIGIMKAVGATNRQVLLIFLTESMYIGLIGGLIGLGAGYLLSKGISAVAYYYGAAMLRTKVTGFLALGSLAFSCFVGVVSGLYPAYRAAKLNPVEALRYE